MANINLTSTTLSGFLEADFDQIKDLVQDGGVTAVEFDVVDLKINGTSVSSTAAELNILDGVTALAADLNIVAGGAAAGVSSTEFQYLNGVTSSIQDQIDAAGTPEGTAILSTGEVGGTKFLREDGDGTCSWQTVAASGDVSKVGTPVDNQVGVWTGDGTIEGDTSLTFDGSILTTDKLAVAQTTTSGPGVSVTRNLAAASTDTALISVNNSNSSDDKEAVRITNSSSGRALYVDQNGASYAASFDTSSSVHPAVIILTNGDAHMRFSDDSANTSPTEGDLWRNTGGLFYQDTATHDLTAPGRITVANETTDTSCYPVFVRSATGGEYVRTNAGLTFNSATSVLTATGFSGPLTGTASGNLVDVSDDTTPTLGGDLDCNDEQINNVQTIDFNAEVDDGNSSTADTIDWTTGNCHKSTMTGNCTYTFTAPDGPARLQLKLVQDGTGSRTATWPASVKWPGGTAPTLTTTATTGTDIITFWYDGTSYFGVASLNFS